MILFLISVLRKAFSISTLLLFKMFGLMVLLL